MATRRLSAPLVVVVVVVVACVALALSGCDSCAREKIPKQRDGRGATTPLAGCTGDEQCETAEPCVVGRCVDGQCAVVPAPAGTSCDNDDVCDGLETCDGRGRCVAGSPPKIDDGNPCTVDTCDPKLGPAHQAVQVDDSDACTRDSCDPVTGEVTHAPLDLDDGDDCTFDACDPKTGVTHRRLPTVHTCDPTCGAGYHPVSRTPSGSCGLEGLQTLCAPDCGDSFYSCNSTCPEGYHTSSRRPGPQCGTGSPLLAFCVKNGQEPFYTCDPRCPPGRRRQGEAPTRHCGPEVTTRIRCI